MKASRIGRSTISPESTGAVKVRVPRRPLARGDYIGLFEIGQDPTAGDRIALACLAHFERPRRPMQQLGTDVRFEEGDSAADRGRRTTELATGAHKTALVERRDKDFHRIDTVHDSSAARNNEPRTIEIGSPYDNA